MSAETSTDRSIFLEAVEFVPQDRWDAFIKDRCADDVELHNRVERLLPMICELVPDGLITVEAVDVVKYAHRDLAAIQQILTVGEVMTHDVKAVHPDTPLAEVVDRLIDQDFRALPVVEDGRLVGIVTNGDPVERGGLPARLERLQVLGPEARHQAAAAPSHTTRDVMTRDPVTIGPDAPVTRAAEVMLERGLERAASVQRTGAIPAPVAESLGADPGIRRHQRHAGGERAGRHALPEVAAGHRRHATRISPCA